MLLGDGDIRDIWLLLHELAEGLQSVGNYLGAARRVTRCDPSERQPDIDILEKALDELSRSKIAFHALRARLSASVSEAGETAAIEGPPMAGRAPSDDGD
jgi:hypothetical protein